MTANIEVTAADIARLAGVGRAAVSNWRRRHADFPAPVGGPPNSPTFDWAEVEAWLINNGRAAAVNTDQRKGTDRALVVLAEAMAALLPALTRGVILDPAGDDETALDAAARRFGPKVRYTSEAGEADAAVLITPTADPPADSGAWPYGPPARADQALGWVQVCLGHLKPGGTAVIAVPFGTAVRASGRRIRADLLRAGVLTHVIGLPEKAGGTGTPWQLWILTRPSGRPTYELRMVDLTDRAADDVPRNPDGWAAVFADPERTREVPSIELLDEDVFLVPAAYLTVAAIDVTLEYAAQRNRYEHLAQRLPGAAPPFARGVGPVTGPLVTVGELARSGAVTVVGRDAALSDDVMVPAIAGGFEAIVADEYILAELKPATVLRCDPAVLDPYFLAGFLRSEINRRQAAGTMGGTFRLDVRRARVPRMPLSEQRRYGEAFRRLLEFAAAADKVAAAAAAATRVAIDGLTNGTFAPDAQ